MSNLSLSGTDAGNPFEAAVRRFLASHAAASSESGMCLDISEKDDAYHVKADIPGVKKKDIRVRVEGNTVRIDAESRHEKETRGDGDRILRSERCYGALSRSFALGHEVDEKKAHAKYEDGVLTLHLPKRSPSSAGGLEVH